ncbi:MAG: glutaminase A [Rikenellaceae bacterium]
MEAKELKESMAWDAMEAAYNKFKDLDGGKNADYIPFLKDVPSDLFGIAITLMSGKTLTIGESDYTFGIESISKVATALLAMNELGAAEMLDKIGADATGLPFNSIMAILLEKDHPSTPLVNAGAISACSMLCPKGDRDEKWHKIESFYHQLCGSRLKLIDELYKSESETDFNNRSIAWLLKNYGRIYDDPELALDLYTRQCSMGVTASQLSVMAGTIAHAGTNPTNGQQLFKPNLSTHIVSMMATVGMYEHSGDWMFQTGLPAKSGVGGGIMGVVPGVMGIAAFSPRLDAAGNSVRAQAALSYIAERLRLNVYSPYRCTIHQHEYVYV